MKKSSILLAAAAIILALPSCTKVIGEGPVQTQTYAITNFSGVSGSIGGKINYTIDPVFKVEIRPTEHPGCARGQQSERSPAG